MVISRRELLRAGTGASGAVLVATAIGACSSDSDDTAAATTLPAPAPPPVTNGDEALARLMAGNRRFVDGSLQNEGRDDVRRAQQAEGQTPFAIVLGCSDSRVLPEVIFDEGIGDLFLVRVAGNTASVPVLIGSLEYAATTFGCHLLMVLGHEDCGAVKATIDVVKKGTSLPGSLPAVVEPILPAVQQVQSEPDDKILQAAIRQNAVRTADQLRTADSLMTDLVSNGQLQVVAAEYLLTSGAVQLL